MSTRRPLLPVQLVVNRDPGATSDADLARALMEGDGWAITETWRRFAPAVVMLAKRTLGSESEAEDIAQEAFHRIFTKAKTLREPERLRSFVFSFAIRVLKTELRSKTARAWLSFQKPETLADIGADHADMESRDLLRRFYALLDRLSPRNRLVFVLRHVESMTVEEVAAHMELSPSTVKRALDRATRKLSQWIESDTGLAEFLAEFPADGGWRHDGHG
ncbi:MAG: sigma-70 family RNA polymerase sigma factor [Polyangiaceae bacterium]